MPLGSLKSEPRFFLTSDPTEEHILHDHKQPSPHQTLEYPKENLLDHSKFDKGKKRVLLVVRDSRCLRPSSENSGRHLWKNKKSMLDDLDKSLPS